MFSSNNMMWYGTILYVVVYGIYFMAVLVSFFREARSVGNFSLYGGLALNLGISWYTLGQRLELSVATILLKIGVTVTLFILVIKGLSELSKACGQDRGEKRTQWGADGVILILYILTMPVAVYGLVTLKEPIIPTSYAFVLFIFFVAIVLIGIANLKRRQRREKAERELFGENP